MKDYQQDWENILYKIKKIGGRIRPFIVEEKATEQDIKEIESTLNYPLPYSFKKVLLEFSRKVDFYWTLPDEINMPEELRDIFSGEVFWNIAGIEDLTDLAKEFEEDYNEEGYISPLRNKLAFATVTNGDYLCFDMSSVEEDKPVVYWSHEEDSVTYLASSFQDYLDKITDLYCIGSEIWQYEGMLTDKGIDTYSDIAKHWKAFFEGLTTLTLEDVQNDLYSLLTFIIMKGKLNEKDKEALSSFDNREILSMIDTKLRELDITNIYDKTVEEILCKVIVEHVGNDAQNYVYALWKDDTIISPENRSYLTANCLDTKEIQMVFNYIEQTYDFKLTLDSYNVQRLLSPFHSREVIHWMWDKVNFPIEGWSTLLADSNPTWEEYKKWLSAEDKYMVTALYALYAIGNQEKEVSRFKIMSPPTKKELIKSIMGVYDKMILKKRKEVAEDIIKNAEYIINK